MRSKRIFLFLFFVFNLSRPFFAQIDTCFWFAAPWSTPDHWYRDPIKLHIATFSEPTTTVYIRQPAAIAPNKYDTVIVVAANSTFDYTFWRDAYVSLTNMAYDSLETRPANTVVPYGLYISSSSSISLVYDIVSRAPNFHNPETFSLKGQNGLGLEFICPFQTVWRNHVRSDQANTPPGVVQPKQQINIVASKANTVVWITPKCAVVGHAANVTYSIMLNNPGDAYTVENLVQNTDVSGNNLSGTIVVADKPIAVTVADDSVITPGGGCNDLIGDQIVPVDIVGKNYIVNKGNMFVASVEGMYVVATENFTALHINDGATTTNTLLNKGDTYYYNMTQPLAYVEADKNVYLWQATGIGCEAGAAILPPLTCAGSSLVAFTRNTNQQFALNILCKNGSQGTFTLNGSTTLIPSTAFTVVPGTATLSGGPYYGAQIQFPIGVLPIGSYSVGNSTDVFALGVFDGGSTTGGLFHYMSSFLRRTDVVTQTLSPVCAGQQGSVAVTGTVSGADITGIWTTSYFNGTVMVNGGGTGTFSPVYTSSLNTISTVYHVSVNDTTFTAPSKTITLYLSSTGSCRSVTDSVKLEINQRPRVTVSSGTIMCKNNIVPVNLSGSVANAVSGIWSGGNGGIFGAPGLETTYMPSQSDLAANSVTLQLTSQAPLPGCPNSVQSLTVGFIDPPVVSIVPDNAVVCTNSSTLALNGSISGITTNGIWQGGTGAYTLTNASPTATYILSPNDLGQHAITLTLTSTDNGICAAESATMLIQVLAEPVLALPADFTVCAGSLTVPLSGTVSGTGTQGNWMSNMANGAFSNPQIQQSPVNTTYSLSVLDTNFVYFVLQSAPGICPVIKDSVKVSVLAAPIVSVNNEFIPVCHNAQIALTGTVSGYTNTGEWSTSSNTTSPGTFTPGANFLNTFYQPSERDIENGFVILTLTSTNNQLCPASSAAFTASFIPSPIARFTFSPKRCLNTPLQFNDASLANGTASLKWNWDFGDNFPGGGSASPDPIKTYTVAQEYLVTLTVTGVSALNTECPDVWDTIIRIKPLPIADFSVAPACQDYPVVFINRSIAPPGSDPIVQWKWEFGDSVGLAPLFTGVPTTTVSYAYPSAERYSAFLTVTATPVGASPSVGCVSEPHREYVDVFPKPKAEFGLTNNPSVVQEPVYFSDFTTPVGNIAQWYWDFGDDGSSDEQAPVHTYQQAGIFSIKLTVIDFAGCIDTLRKEIDVTLLPQLPGAFTPNGDGVNDLLFVKGGPFEKMLFRVYNNWGELIWETSDQNLGWDGRKNGVEQPVGVYIWTLVVDMYNNRQVRKNGDVTLIR